MNSESHWVFERLKLYQLAQLHPDWSLRHYARELGHDLKWVRRWLARIQAAAPLSIDTFKSRSRAPHHPPPRISDEAKQLVGDLRRELSEQFHRRAGAKTILYGLQRYQQTHSLSFTLPRARSTITRILNEFGWIVPPRR